MFMQKIIRFIGVGLILSSLFMFGYIFTRDYKIAKDIEQGKQEIIVKAQDNLTDSEKNNLKDNNDNNDNNNDNEPLVTKIDKDNRGLVVGKIAIPSINLSLPIYKGEFGPLGDNMLYGAVTNKENQEMGKRNYVLSSHIVNNPDYLFTSLHKVSNGDLVYISDNENIFTYEITKSLVVKPNETWILDDIPNKATITLYTCKYINEFENGVQKTDRTVKFGDLIKKEKSNKNLNDKLFGF